MKTFPFMEMNDILTLLEVAKYEKFNNKAVIIQPGQFAPNFYFILKGTVRAYFIEDSGVEKNIFLKPEFNFIGSPNSLFEDLPAKNTFEAVQATSLLIFPKSKFLQLVETNSAINKMYITVLVENVQTLIFRVEMLATMTPEERYQALLERSPILFQKAFNKHIANYLGITPNSLSRIIKRRKEGE